MLNRLDVLAGGFVVLAASNGLLLLLVCGNAVSNDAAKHTCAGIVAGISLLVAELLWVIARRRDG